MVMREDVIGNSLDELKSATMSLLAYCEKNEWAGYDPYDALNSGVIRSLPFIDSKLIRIIFTQLLKRSPLNIRPLLSIPKTQNPKAIALFLMALLKLEGMGLLDKKDLIGTMITRLMALRSQNKSYWCWGYSFPWQTRTVLVPRGEPNLVCTSFAANALLDAYERNRDAECLTMAISSAEYILDNLYWTDGDSIASFSYPLPSSRVCVHNANFLGAALLCRVYKHCREMAFLNSAMRVARYSAAKQHTDGSWDYGELPTQKWKDNFHTGYDLCALRIISECAGTNEFEINIQRGFKFYQEHFILENGATKYFHNKTYPIDIHSVAQSIITLLTLKELDERNCSKALSVFEWSMRHMRDEQGYFYYQVQPFYTCKIPYMRWAQSWMLLALSTLLDEVINSRGKYVHD